MDYRVIKIGIASFEEYKKRTLAIAKGEYKPMPDEPKIWFESSQSVEKILSDSDCNPECNCQHNYSKQNNELCEYIPAQ